MNSISKNFILFFLVSVVFWFLTKLSKEYESTITYPISYENLPADKLVEENPQTEIEVHIKATGFKILSGKMFPRTLKINAASLTAKSKNKYFLLLPQQRLAIQKQMNAGVTIDHFIKDSITLSLGFLGKKKVPVQLQANLSYQAGFSINDEILIQPDSIEISGPESVLETISFIETENLTKSNIHESIHTELSLKKRDANQNVTFGVQKVSVDVSVEKFTEGTITIPITVINLPDDVQINTFPKEVDLTYKVALSKFSQIQTASFSVECDYQLSAENNLSYLVPKLARQSNLVKNVHITPSKIDFVIEK